MNLINIIRKILGKIIYSKGIRLSEPLILHVTDTPTTIYSEVNKLIKDLKPEYIIHTGDLADNIKIGLYPYRLKDYKKKAKQILNMLEMSDAKVYITIGNHDDEVFVRSNCNKATVFHQHRKVCIEGLNFLCVHDLKDLNSLETIETSRYVLCGHSYDFDHVIPKEKLLNGLKGIHLIYPQSKKIFRLNYPIGTDESRMQKSRIGI